MWTIEVCLLLGLSLLTSGQHPTDSGHVTEIVAQHVSTVNLRREDTLRTWSNWCPLY
jgi:hypothetical protein